MGLQYGKEIFCAAHVFYTVGGMAPACVMYMRLAMILFQKWTMLYSAVMGRPGAVLTELHTFASQHNVPVWVVASSLIFAGYFSKLALNYAKML